ncbi:MAG TPA: YbhB/YbcL family Raf kinase inhibitor-like protein [Chthoniobacterales bacterium]|nr:YbhB/YbcL family Raf kinase inhibitor-like protein [Chthoniobacterales bacterium]
MKPISFTLAIFVGTILNINAASSVSVATSAFQAGGDIPAKFTCNGANVNPALKINGVPNEAKSLVLIVDDPDAPRALFTHWILWNIDPKTTDIGENSVPAGGVQGTNDFGKRNYGGPCPPSGTHRYFFKIFALDMKLDLKPGARRADLDAAMKSHILAQGELMARYAHK